MAHCVDSTRRIMRSFRLKVSDGKRHISSSTSAWNAFQFTPFQRYRGLVSCFCKIVVEHCRCTTTGRWSDPVSATDHWHECDRLGWVRMMSGVLRLSVPLFTLVLLPSFKTMKPVLPLHDSKDSPLLSEGWTSSYNVEGALKSPQMTESLACGRNCHPLTSASSGAYTLHIHRISYKTTRYLIAHNFSKCWPIFKFFFTLGLSSDCVTRWSLKIQSHLKHVDTLPRKTLVFKLI